MKRITFTLMLVALLTLTACSNGVNSNSTDETFSGDTTTETNKPEAVNTGGGTSDKTETTTTNTQSTESGNFSGSTGSTNANTNSNNEVTATKPSAPGNTDSTTDSNTKPSGSSTTTNSSTKPSGTTNNTNNQTSGKGHYEEREVLVKEAYDEEVLVKKGACTDVLISEAYDTQEIVYLDGAYYGADYEMRAWCYVCEHWYDDHCQSEGHACNNKEFYTSDPYWHNVEYKTVHHDAVYNTICEDDEYKTIHHEAEYKTEKVWVED